MEQVALSISGGGSKGAFAVGAVDALRATYEFPVISGTSTGALIAPMVAIGDYDGLINLYSNVTDKDILRLNWRRLFLDCIYDTKPLEETIRKALDEEERYERLMESETEILLCSVSFQTQKVQYFSQRGRIPGTVAWKDKDELVKAILASTNQPVYMPLVSIRGEQYADGGVREVAPIEILQETGLDKAIAIINHPEEINLEPSEKRYGFILDAGMRALTLMSSEISDGDVIQLAEKHDLLWYIDECKARAAEHLTIQQLDEVFGPGEPDIEPLDIVFVRPEKNLPSDGLSFEPEVMRRMIDLGREAALKVINDG